MIETPRAALPAKAGIFPARRRRPLTGLIASALIALPAPTPAAPSRADRALDGPPAVYIDPGPADARITPVGPVIIQLLHADEVRRLCPAGIDWHSLACTIMPGRIVLMPDEESSGLSTGQWLALLRHELLHAIGLDFHGGAAMNPEWAFGLTLLVFGIVAFLAMPEAPR